MPQSHVSQSSYVPVSILNKKVENASSQKLLENKLVATAQIPQVHQQQSEVQSNRATDSTTRNTSEKQQKIMLPELCFPASHNIPTSRGNSARSNGSRRSISIRSVSIRSAAPKGSAVLENNLSVMVHDLGSSDGYDEEPEEASILTLQDDDDEDEGEEFSHRMLPVVHCLDTDDVAKDYS